MMQNFDCSLEVKGNLRFPLDITYHGCPGFSMLICAEYPIHFGTLVNISENCIEALKGTLGVKS
jgi:hypothetical protein